MKKLIAIILLLVSITSVASAEQNLYLRFGTIVDIEYDTDFVTVDDGFGNLWDFYNYPLSAYNYYGDIVVMIMSDAETPDWIYDDDVINAYFCTGEEAYEIIRDYNNAKETIFTQLFQNLF